MRIQPRISVTICCQSLGTQKPSPCLLEHRRCRELGWLYSHYSLAQSMEGHRDVWNSSGVTTEVREPR